MIIDGSSNFTSNGLLGFFVAITSVSLIYQRWNLVSIVVVNKDLQIFFLPQINTGSDKVV